MIHYLSSTKIYIIIIVVLAIFTGYYYAQKNLESINQPPIFGGTDQLDYNNMAYAMMKTNIPGVMMTDEYKEPFKSYLESNKDNRYILRTVNAKNKKLRPYAYRPLLYSMVLGINYKIFGYSFNVARIFNIFCIVLGSLLLFLIVKNLSNEHFAFMGALLYVSLPNVIKYSNLLLSEVFVVTMLILFLYLLQKSFMLNEKRYWFLTGLVFGLLVLSKQMFYLIFFPLFTLIIFHLIRKKKKEMIYYTLTPFFLLIFPWFAYNIAITGNTGLKTGSSGWHDMPSAYSQGYLDGKNRFKIREEIFKEYEMEHGVKIRGDIQRSIFGKKIFFEKIYEEEILFLLPKLMFYKVKLALNSNYYTYLILFIISLISLIYLYKARALSVYLISIILIAYMNLFIVSVTFADSGRLISGTFPIFIIMFLVLSYHTSKGMNFERNN